MSENPILAEARAVDLAKIRQARRMSEEARVLAGPRLFGGVCARMKEGLADENPGATPDQIHRLLLSRLALLAKLERRANS